MVLCMSTRHVAMVMEEAPKGTSHLLFRVQETDACRFVKLPGAPSQERP